MTSHGYNNNDRVYRIWKGLKQRCDNPSSSMYASYGARGITVCKRWSSFALFLADMGEPPSTKHSIDRINNNRGYKLSNCRWSTRAEQSRNRSDNVNITFKGKTQCLTDWSAELNIPMFTLHSRLGKLGWSVKRALTTPTGHTGKSRSYTAYGHTLTIKQWSERLSVSTNTLASRIRYGWPLDRVFV